MSAIPLPNYTGPIANVNSLLQGAIPPGGHFVISDSSNSNLANFGSFVYVNMPNTGNQFWRTNMCSLVVDGVLVSSSLVTFQSNLASEVRREAAHSGSRSAKALLVNSGQQKRNSNSPEADFAPVSFEARFNMSRPLSVHGI